jgi:hypothetical protein
MNLSMRSASSSFLPLTRSIVGFIFLNEIPVFATVALTGNGQSSLYATLVVRSDFVECPLKVLVGANSPSRCPTMFSVINSGTCRRPS